MSSLFHTYKLCNHHDYITWYSFVSFSFCAKICTNIHFSSHESFISSSGAVILFANCYLYWFFFFSFLVFNILYIHCVHLLTFLVIPNCMLSFLIWLHWNVKCRNPIEMSILKYIYACKKNWFFDKLRNSRQLRCFLSWTLSMSKFCSFQI